MKQGDVGTNLIFTIRDEKGDPVDLSSAVAVYLIMRIDTQRFERICDIIDPARGKVRYVVSEEDTASPGALVMELRVEFNNGAIFTTSRVREVIEATL